jgi:hypothetical protein
MKPLHCRCGQRVYFDSHHCGHCGRALAFDPEILEMVAETEPGAGLPFCGNRHEDPHCNWLAPAGGVCTSCRMSRVIPALSKVVNRWRWQRLEQAKRRLLYDLLRLGLPVDPAELSFVFKEDRRSNPDVSEDHVAIGHFDGVITINAAEADEVYREQMRQALGEPVRTLLGHFRHESGHYYRDQLLDEAQREAARDLFGDDRVDYDAALQRHYESGPPADWSEHFISAYAAAHPIEDWAECWAHYLHMQAALETARSLGWYEIEGQGGELESFIKLAIGLNELVRSLGLPDAYPFVISPAVGKKLEFVADAVRRFRTPRS